MQRKLLPMLVLSLIANLSAYAGVSAQGLLENARKEGQVVFYSSLDVQTAQQIVAGFEKKYPIVKVDATRIGSERMATRLIAEAQARKVRADIVHQSAFDFYGVLQKGLFDS
jgi:iron(III) transport system substrate-binding protein